MREIEPPPKLTWKRYDLDFADSPVDLWCPETAGFNNFEAGDWRRKGGIDKAELERFKAFQDWRKSVQRNLARQITNENHPHHERPYSLKSIHINAITRSPHGAVIFVKMEAWIQRQPDSVQRSASEPGQGEGKVSDESNEEQGQTESVRTPAGDAEQKTPASDPRMCPTDYSNTLYETVFLRGGSVAILMILRPSDKRDERWVILTEQPRVPACSLRFVEIPAGMMDDENNFKGVAAREIEEETGLKIPESELINMTEMALRTSLDDSAGDPEDLVEAMYPSPGGCDEYISLFLWEKGMDRVHIEALRGKISGLRTAGETITLRLEKYTDLWKVGARDAKTLGAWALYEGLSTSGMLEQQEKQREMRRPRTGGTTVSAMLGALRN